MSQESSTDLADGAGGEVGQPHPVAETVGGEANGTKFEPFHRGPQDKKSGQGNRGAVGRHSGQSAKFGEGKWEKTKEKGLELREGEREAFQPPGFHISATEEAGVGVSRST